ncbi:hypothetical protein V491_02715 [Pseudogymnoascus sp. VKM F-3775]|nr:hypothetical protein V491_02715 [Pseudogymnoascus sp. VKM F-3775]
MDSGLLRIAEYTVYYTIHNSTGFYAELQELYGILPEWVVLSDEDFDPPCVTAPQSAQLRMASLTNALYSAKIDLNLGLWLGPAIDLLEVLLMLLFKIMQVIDSMLQAKDIGEEMREEERRNFILIIISIIFSILPFVGEALGFIGGTAVGIGRIAVLVSTRVDIGLGIEQIVQDKASAPMAILVRFAQAGQANNNSSGPCDATEGDPKNIVKIEPNPAVVFSNVKWGEIGSTFSGRNGLGEPGCTPRPHGPGGPKWPKCPKGLKGHLAQEGCAQQQEGESPIRAVLFSA